ncbi:hypothetical protein JZ751_003609 [Albula glossodonta]|uniref:Uncharacterized protein n=1 Tax=Albula glossodonta TaxID=121402 RepID=A0A8T2NDS3_9TELE|nr:hypothetical protein JZ751_003609 [Albula glossodonta]
MLENQRLLQEKGRKEGGATKGPWFPPAATTITISMELFKSLSSPTDRNALGSWLVFYIMRDHGYSRARLLVDVGTLGHQEGDDLMMQIQHCHREGRASIAAPTGGVCTLKHTHSMSASQLDKPLSSTLIVYKDYSNGFCSKGAGLMAVSRGLRSLICSCLASSSAICWFFF